MHASFADSRRDVNEEITRAINAKLLEVLGEHVSTVLHKHLNDHYDIGPAEMSYRLPTIYQILGEMFGEVGAKSFGSVIAKRLYSQLGIRFAEHSNYTLEDYIEEAMKLLQRP